MTEIYNASFDTHLEVREALDGDGFNVTGRLVPYDVITHGAGRTSAGTKSVYSEVFRQGAFAKTIAENGNKVVLRPAHGAAPVGKAVKLEERSDGLWGEFRVSDVTAGREMLTLMRDGVTNELSIEFVPVRSKKNEAGVMERSEVILRGVAATAHPAYQGAMVDSIRDTGAIDPDATPRRDKAARELARLKAIKA